MIFEKLAKYEPWLSYGLVKKMAKIILRWPGRVICGIQKAISKIQTTTRNAHVGRFEPNLNAVKGNSKNKKHVMESLYVI
jgi:hypothetical protein